MIRFMNRKDFNEFAKRYNNVYLIDTKDEVEYWSVGKIRKNFLLNSSKSH